MVLLWGKVSYDVDKIPGISFPIMVKTANTNAFINMRWILIRQYLSTEPAWGTWGPQETL